MPNEENKIEEEINPIPKKPLREIVIKTDGDNIFLSKADVSGRIELVGVLQTLLQYLSQKTNGIENK